MCTNTPTMICKIIRYNFAILNKTKSPITKWTNVCIKHWFHKSQGIIDQTKEVYIETFNFHFSMLLIFFSTHIFEYHKTKNGFLLRIELYLMKILSLAFFQSLIKPFWKKFDNTKWKSFVPLAFSWSHILFNCLVGQKWQPLL